jgi:hypothetical protein
MDKADHVFRFQEFDAENDLTAVNGATLLRSWAAMELWTGNRRVRRWEVSQGHGPSACDLLETSALTRSTSMPPIEQSQSVEQGRCDPPAMRNWMSLEGDRCPAS